MDKEQWRDVLGWYCVLIDSFGDDVSNVIGLYRSQVLPVNVDSDSGGRRLELEYGCCCVAHL